MIFLQEDHHAIGQFYAAWLLRIKRREWWNYDLAPVSNLALSGGQKGAQTQSQYQNGSEPITGHHCCSFLPPAICVDSIIPRTRLESTNVWLATRRISAFWS